MLPPVGVCTVIELLVEPMTKALILKKTDCKLLLPHPTTSTSSLVIEELVQGKYMYVFLFCFIEHSPRHA